LLFLFFQDTIPEVLLFSRMLEESISEQEAQQQPMTFDDYSIGQTGLTLEDLQALENWGLACPGPNSAALLAIPELPQSLQNDELSSLASPLRYPDPETDEATTLNQSISSETTDGATSNQTSQEEGPPPHLQLAKTTSTDLPAGWERAISPEGHIYYLDHNQQKTQWRPPKDTRPLPHGWSRWTNSEGDIFYVDHKGKITQWDRPIEHSTYVAELPVNWEERKTPQGETYYVDHVNKKTQWKKPKWVPPYPSPPKEDMPEIPPYPKSDKSSSLQLPLGWEERETPEGVKYYVDHAHKKTQWKRPKGQAPEPSAKSTAPVTIKRDSDSPFSSRAGSPKVGVLRDSHNLFSTPYRIFECFFGANKKTVLAGLRVKKQ
jgi:hypothetical protein